MLETIVNPGRDLSALDVDASRVDRALAAVRAVGVRRPGFVEIGSTTLVFESMQITGSFKVRGAIAGISAHIDEARSKGVIAASAGNHGAGVAWASRALGVHATVVVPKTSPEVKRARIAESAELIVEGDGYDAAETAAIDLARARGALFLSPYDDVDVAAGNGGTLARDIDEKTERTFHGRRVLCPLGGGGLASGLAAGFANPREIWGVQSTACPAIARSLQRGAAIEAMHATGPTVAEGLEGGVSKSGFDRVRRALSGVLVVDEDAIVRAMRWARSELGVILEGSSAAALVPLLSGHEIAQAAVIVITGRNVGE